jgi:hypothetical protein
MWTWDSNNHEDGDIVFFRNTVDLQLNTEAFWEPEIQLKWDGLTYAFMFARVCLRRGNSLYEIPLIVYYKAHSRARLGWSKQSFHRVRYYIILVKVQISCRWKWPHGHDLSSPARILGSWVRITFEAWFFRLCVCSVCVGLYGHRGLATGWPLVLESYRLRVG